MKNIKLIFKNLYYLVKTRKVFFTLMCMGQIVSLCVVLILTGVVQVNLSEENLEWYGDLSAFSVRFNDNDNISVEKWKKVTEKFKKYLKDDFCSMCMEGRSPGEELGIQTLYPGEKFKEKSNDVLTYDDYVGNDKIVIYTLYEDKPKNKIYKYGGEEYKIIGYVNYTKSFIPMNVLPEKFEVKYTQLCIDGMLSNRKVSEISDMIKKLFDTNAEVQCPEGIDLLGIQGNNMVTMSTVLSVILLAFNSFVCYYYIFDKRKNWLIVTRITGCTKRKAMNVYMGEMLIILIANSLIGLLIFTQVIYPFMVHRKGFYSEIYDVRTYVLCAAIFVLFSMAISYIGVISTLGKSVMDLKKK